MRYRVVFMLLLILGTSGCSTLPTCDGSNLRPVNQVPVSATCHHPSCKTLINYH